MHRLVVMTALLLAMGVALPAWADGGGDCDAGKILGLSALERRRCADQGVAEAQFFLGANYFFGTQGVSRDYAEAMKWFRKAADQGNAGAQGMVGNMYEHGLNVPQNYAEAVRWYRKGADQGEEVSQLELGVLYTKGLGVPQDFVQAHMWSNLAAAQGNTDAAKHREILAAMMTPAQIEKAQALAAVWKPTTSQ